MNIYAIKLASRHLLSHPGQTVLLMLGVALGVGVFIFMSALIGGLANLLTMRTVGSIPHIVLEMPDRTPVKLTDKTGTLLVTQKDLSRRNQIAIWRPAYQTVSQTNGVAEASAQIRGSAFVERGQAIAPVSVIGVPAGEVSRIADIGGAIINGDADLPANGVMIGSRLADDLGLRIGQTIRITSDRARERNFRVQGIFELGVAGADRQTVYMNFMAARALFDMPTAVSRIEIKLDNPLAAAQSAPMLMRATGLKATAWTEENAQLFEGLSAQARTGVIIKAFSLVTIIIGIASAMLLSVARRRSEIGIMRAMGASKALVVAIFIIEGTMIGFIGAVAGAIAAWFALAPFPPIAEISDGGLPIDRAQGDFVMAILLTTAAAIAASILPARRVAKIDPVEAISI